MMAKDDLVDRLKFHIDRMERPSEYQQLIAELKHEQRMKLTKDLLNKTAYIYRKKSKEIGYVKLDD